MRLIDWAGHSRYVHDAGWWMLPSWDGKHVAWPNDAPLVERLLVAPITTGSVRVADNPPEGQAAFGKATQGGASSFGAQHDGWINPYGATDCRQYSQERSREQHDQREN